MELHPVLAHVHAVHASHEGDQATNVQRRAGVILHNAGLGKEENSGRNHILHQLHGSAAFMQQLLSFMVVKETNKNNTDRTFRCMDAHTAVDAHTCIHTLGKQNRLDPWIHTVHTSMHTCTHMASNSSLAPAAGIPTSDTLEDPLDPGHQAHTHMET